MTSLTEFLLGLIGLFIGGVFLLWAVAVLLPLLSRVNVLF